ncbi:lipid uptake coordinator LucA [soil metagenome]
MRRGLAMSWHGLSFLLAAVLYFVFVLPRWWELTGDVSHGLGTAMRIVTGAVLGLTALPVVFTLIRTRRPEFGTPQLALSLRLWSIVAHVVAGVLIIGTGIAEIWLDLDTYGQWLFGVYGGAAAIAVLAAVAFYLAFAAELPPPPPKPLKPKKAKASREKASTTVDEPEEPEESVATTEADDSDDAVAQESTEDEKADATAGAATDTEAEPADVDAATEEKAPALRNRRPSGKTRASR